MYSIIISDPAKKELSKLNKDDRHRVYAVLERIRIRPHAFVKKLVGVEYYSVRAGKYRVILDIQKDKLVILVLEVGHRKNIYNNLKKH